MRTLCSLLLPLFLCITHGIEGRLQSTKPYLVVTNMGGGMFSSFDSILGAIDLYDRGLISGVEVDFENAGTYYDPLLGPTWWDYFCLPIKLGEPSKRVIRTSMPGKLKDFYRIEYCPLRRSYWAALIQKYITIGPLLQQKIDTFAAAWFSDVYVIGIHYRGTDKYTEAPRVAYESAIQQIQEQVHALGAEQYRIFIATDEASFLDYIDSFFPGHICYCHDMARSTDGTPIHLDSRIGGYEKGESALIDCVLLSRCDFLIRCSSNLSRWSTYFNPDIPVVELNQRH